MSFKTARSSLLFLVFLALPVNAQEVSIENNATFKQSIEELDGQGKTQVEILFEVSSVLKTSEAINQLGSWKIKKFWEDALLLVFDKTSEVDLQEEFLEMDIFYRDALELLEFHKGLKSVRFENEGTKRDLRVLSGFEYEYFKKTEKNYEFEGEGVRLWNEEVFFPYIEESLELLRNEKVSWVQSKAKGDAAMSFLAGRVVGTSWSGHGESVYDIVFLHTFDQKVAKALSEKISYLLFPKSLAVGQAADSLDFSRSTLKRNDRKKIDQALRGALEKWNSSFRPPNAFHAQFDNELMHHRLFRAINSFYFWAYYPQFVEARPSVSTLAGLLEAEKNLDRLEPETVELYLSKLENRK